MKTNLKNLTFTELQALVSDFNLENYRTRQIFQWVFQKNITEIDEITSISKDTREKLAEISIDHSNKLLVNYRAFALPDRLWNYLLEKYEFSKSKKWNELGKKGINKLINILTNDIYSVKGQTKFKEEFVTCGGVNLDNVNVEKLS